MTNDAPVEPALNENAPAIVEYHPIANLFPMFSEKRLEELAADIKAHGLLVPIVQYEGKILDGRNRYRACRLAGVNPRYIEFDGDNPWEFSWSWNGQRRDVDGLQRSILYERSLAGSKEWENNQKKAKQDADDKRSVATKKQPRKNGKLAPKAGGGHLIPTTCKPSKKEHKTRKTKAAVVGVSESTIRDAEMLNNNYPELANKVVTGEITGKGAKKLIRQSKQKAKEASAAAAIIPVKRPWKITKEQDVIKCDAVIVDPPYGILDEDWEPDELKDFTIDWATRWAASGADFIATFFSQEFMWDARQWFDASLQGYHFQHLLVWNYKNNKKPQSRLGMKQTWEPIFLYRRDGSEKKITVSGTEWGDDSHDFDCHTAATPQTNFKDDNMKQHPAQKPLSVMLWLVGALTGPGDMVADPFCGSGTTGIACSKLNRRFHGIETNDGYIKIAQERIACYGT